MGRGQRPVSSTGIYHIVINAKLYNEAFVNPIDYRQVIYYLKNAICKYNIKIYGYCIIPERIQLMIHDQDSNISSAISYVICQYVRWHNRFYGHRGSLFDKRYRSLPLESWELQYETLRYIHQTPIRENIVANLNEYCYSSLNEYMSQMDVINNKLKIGRTENIVDAKYILSKIEIEEFIRFNYKKSYFKSKLDAIYRDSDAVQLMRSITGCDTAFSFLALDSFMQEKCIKKMHCYGLTQKQTSMVTGLSLYIIRKYIAQ